MRTTTLPMIPYAPSHASFRMGGGRNHLLAAALTLRLPTLSEAVDARPIHHQTEPPTEIATSFELMRTISREVRLTVEAGRLPIVLAGNCNTAVGTMSGLASGTGVVWFDAHGDFNTPDTTPSGYLDGTGLATLTGRCWRTLARTVPDFTPIPDDHVVLVGARDLDPQERQLLDASRIQQVPPNAIGDDTTLADAISKLAANVNGAYLHIDLDVLGVSEGRANSHAAPGGITAEELRNAITTVGNHMPIHAIALTAYDATTDTTGSVARIAIECATTAVTAATTPRN